MGSPDKNREPEHFRKLFIGGLDYKTSEEELKEFFEQWGELVDVVVMKDPKTKRARGFGFITYARMSMLDKAMANRPHKITGRQVEAKRAVPRDEIGNVEAKTTTKKLFVGGVKEFVEEDDLRTHFGQYGNIINISFPTEKDTGKRRGFVFIDFDDYDPVDKIILMGNHIIKGKRVDVKKALPKEALRLSKEESNKRGGRNDSGDWNNRSSPMGGQKKWGDGYGTSPWNTDVAGQGWEGPSQPWGYNQNADFGYGQPWGGAQENRNGGGPLRNNMYLGNRNAPYG